MLQGGGGWYSDIFIHTEAQFSFLFFFFFFWFFFFFFFFWGGGGQKNEKIGVWRFCGYFWVITNWTLFRGHFYAFKDLFLRQRYRMGDIFGLLKFQIFFWMLEITDIF